MSAERGAHAAIGPAVHLLQTADPGEFQPCVAVDADIFLQLLDIDAEQVIEPGRDRRRIDFRPLGLQPAVDVVVGIAFDGLQIKLAGDLHDRLRLQPVNFDRIEFAEHLAQCLDESSQSTDAKRTYPISDPCAGGCGRRYRDTRRSRAPPRRSCPERPHRAVVRYSRPCSASVHSIAHTHPSVNGMLNSKPPPCERSLIQLVLLHQEHPESVRGRDCAAPARSSDGIGRSGRRRMRLRSHRRTCLRPSRRQCALTSLRKKFARFPVVKLVGQHWPISASSRPRRRSFFVAAGSGLARYPKFSNTAWITLLRSPVQAAEQNFDFDRVLRG